MGTLLDKPETSKQTEANKGNGIDYGVCSMQGWRNSMEDAHTAKIGLSDQLKDWSFFAVYDGHAGESAAKYCSENLLNSIIESEEFKKSLESDVFKEEQIELAKQGIRNGFLTLDKKMRDLPDVVEKKDKSGSTAVCCLISPKYFFFINCGDSRSVLSRENKVMFSTNDHKPFHVAEKERIQNAGGSVMLQRVNGSLAVSRALGDYEYKHNEDKTDIEQLVSPEPEINVIERDDAKDEFIILACDGIFDVINNEDLCTYVRYLYEINFDTLSVTIPILDTCLHKGSLDNMTVIVVTLPAAPKTDNAKVELDKKLDDEIKSHIEKMLSLNEEENEKEFEDVLKSIEELKLANLPPAVGLDGKKKFIADHYSRVAEKPVQYSHQGPMRGW